MTVCEMEADEVGDFLPLDLMDDDLIDAWRECNSKKSIRDKWPRMPVRFLTPEEDDVVDGPATRTDSDCCWILGMLILVLSQRAVDALGNVLEQYGELLPLESTEAELYAYHVMNVTDALLLDDCDIEYYETGNMRRINRFSFNLDRLAGQEIFRVPVRNEYAVYVQEPFLQRVRDANLIGFEFTPVWNSNV